MLVTRLGRGEEKQRERKSRLGQRIYIKGKARAGRRHGEREQFAAGRGRGGENEKKKGFYGQSLLNELQIKGPYIN